MRPSNKRHCERTSRHTWRELEPTSFSLKFAFRQVNGQDSLPIATLYSPDPALPASAQVPFPAGYNILQAKSPGCKASASCVSGIGVGTGMSSDFFISYRNPHSIQWNANVQFSAPFGIMLELDQSDTARLGELFPGWAFEFLFHAGQRMGRKKSQASSDACPGTKRLGLEAVE